MTKDWKALARDAAVATYTDAWIVSGARTPFADYNGVFADVSAIDLGIKAGRASIERGKLAPHEIDATFAGEVGQSGFDALFFPRHVGLYSGVPAGRPALAVHRVCCTGYELVAQAAAAITAGAIRSALCVGGESMTRHPLVAYAHRGGFRLGQVRFGDFLWEASRDPSTDTNMGGTAENLATQYRITRDDADLYAAQSFARAVAAQQAGVLAEEIVAVKSETFDLEGYRPRQIRLPRGVNEVRDDTHVRPSSKEKLSTLPAAFGGVQTGGNSSAIVDGAAAVVVANGALAERHGRKPLGRIVAAATVGVPPEIMGIGPVPAIHALLGATGLTLADIDRFEINEAFAAQTLACIRALELDEGRLNVNGGAIAFGHPLAATGVRGALSLLLELRRKGLKRGIISACAGGGQGMAVLLEAA